MSGPLCAKSALPGNPLLCLKPSVLPGPCFGICSWTVPALLPAPLCPAQSCPMPSSEQHPSTFSPGKPCSAHRGVLGIQGQAGKKGGSPQVQF